MAPSTISSQPSAPTPPILPHTTSTSTSTPDASISSQIDTLLESYLALLDTYTKLRTTLSAELSSGFFSLAQAQRSSTLGSGRRYGEECYDGRMKAERGVNFRAEQTGEHEEGEEQDGEGDQVVVLSVCQITQAQTEVEPEAGNASVSSNASTRIADSPPPGNAASDTNASTSQTAPLKPRSKDPLRMFGIFTPPALRQCQTSFMSAVSSSIPSLINTSNRMLALELRIKDLRAQLESEVTKGQDSMEDGLIAEALKYKGGANVDCPSKKLVSSPRKRNKTSLPSRPSEPRSRILKMD